MSDAAIEIEVGPDEDHFWSSTLLLPNPSAMDDVAMQVSFPRFDGRWNSYVQNARTALGATGLELNVNWALTPSYWTCPACGRPKSDILRLSGRGVLLAKLDRHHDHAGDDLVSRHLGKGPELRNRETATLFNHLKRLMIRFEPTFVCTECNAADGAAKARLRGEIDTRFSFTASEIGRFVAARANHPHAVDLAKAREIWLEQEPVFRRRDEISRQMHEAIRDGVLVHDISGSTTTQMADRAFTLGDTLVQALITDGSLTGDLRRASGLYKAFLARSTCRDIPAPEILAQRRSAAAPATADLEAYVDVVSPRSWNEAGEHWRCPACARSRLEAVRVGKTGKLTGGVGRHYEYIEEVDPEEIRRRAALMTQFSNGRYLAAMREVNVCTDCRDVTTRLKQQRPELLSPWLSIADLRAVIVGAAPHQAHNFDVDEAAARAIANRSLRDADDEFASMRELGSRSASEFDYLRANAVPEEDAWLQVAESTYAINMDFKDEARALARWLVQFAMRPRDAER